MEKNDLSIATRNTDLITGNSLDLLDSLCADILCENEDFVLDLETAKVTALCASEQKFFSRLAESETSIISDKCSSVHQFRFDLAI